MTEFVAIPVHSSGLPRVGKTNGVDGNVSTVVFGLFHEVSPCPRNASVTPVAHFHQSTGKRRKTASQNSATPSRPWGRERLNQSVSVRLSRCSSARSWGSPGRPSDRTRLTVQDCTNGQLSCHVASKGMESEARGEKPTRTLAALNWSPLTLRPSKRSVT